MPIVIDTLTHGCTVLVHSVNGPLIIRLNSHPKLLESGVTPTDDQICVISEGPISLLSLGDIMLVQPPRQGDAEVSGRGTDGDISSIISTASDNRTNQYEITGTVLYVPSGSEVNTHGVNDEVTVDAPPKTITHFHK